MPAPGKGKVFVCGPPPMLNALAGPKAKDYSQGEIGGALKNLGYTSEQIFKI
jgi:cytochrome-b5 reductase